MRNSSVVPPYKLPCVKSVSPAFKMPSIKVEMAAMPDETMYAVASKSKPKDSSAAIFSATASTVGLA